MTEREQCVSCAASHTILICTGLHAYCIRSSSCDETGGSAAVQSQKNKYKWLYDTSCAQIRKNQNAYYLTQFISISFHLIHLSILLSPLRFFAIASIQQSQSLTTTIKTFMICSPAPPSQGDITDLYGTRSSFWPPLWSIFILIAIIGLGFACGYCKTHHRTIIYVSHLLCESIVLMRRWYHSNTYGC